MRRGENGNKKYPLGFDGLRVLASWVETKWVSGVFILFPLQNMGSIAFAAGQGSADIA